MVKTLRITSVVAVMIAIAIFVLPIKYGVRTDANIESFLSTPGVVEKFKTSSGNRKQIPTNQVHPLVQQAQAFALILNPPKPPAPPRPVRPSQGRITVLDKNAKNSPMFKVKATIFYADYPELSQALIDEPGKGSHWVRQSSTVNHLFIAQVKNGVIVVKNGDESFELKAEERKLSFPAPLPVGRSIPKSNPAIRPIRTLPPPAPEVDVEKKPDISKTEPDPEKAQRVQEFIEQIKLIGSTGSDSGLSNEERAAQIQKLITDFKNSKINIDDEEAQKLSDLGDMLQRMQPPESEK